MITIRKSLDRGRFDFGWLKTSHTFSFGDYHDPGHVHFRALRVINEDIVAPGAGFPTHPHRDMEIISYVLAGAIAHRDSMGNEETLRPGEVQRMTAGSGVRHSEFNPSRDEPLHLLQIWLFPEAKGLTPGYEQKAFDPPAPGAPIQLLASRGGENGSVVVHQDVRLYRAVLGAGGAAELPIEPGRYAWVQVARGGITLNGAALAQGDGAAVSDETLLQLAADEPAEALIFDLA